MAPEGTVPPLNEPGGISLLASRANWLLVLVLVVETLSPLSLLLFFSPFFFLLPHYAHPPQFFFPSQHFPS